jgi:hypothetical protein
MKTSVKIIIGVGLFILLAGTIGICIHHYHGKRGMKSLKGTAYFHKQVPGQRGKWGNARQGDMPMMRGMRPGMEQGPMNGMRRGMSPGPMNGMGRGMGQGPANGMGRGMGQRPMNGMQRGMGRGRGPMAINPMMRGNMGPGRMMEMIPGLTDKQKKDIADLRQKQQDDMKKVREEVTKKMKDLSETHRKKVMDLLTPDQKKFVESHAGNTGTAPSK